MRELSLTAAYLSERSAKCIAAYQKCAVLPCAWHLPPAVKQNLWIEIHALVCLVWVDVLAGTALGYYLFRNADAIVEVLGRWCHQIQDHLILGTLEWFNHSPGGVKLNTVITRHLGALLSAIVRSFGALLLGPTQPLHATAIRLIACCGSLGVTVQLVMIVDLLRVLTLHIALLHRALSALHQFQLQSLRTLWLLFGGQKKNVLRRRVDSCHFGRDQLLFGIVLFSIAMFLFPTFAAYFFLFALAQLGSVYAQYLVFSSSVAVKEFPYYSAALRLLRPAIVSDGIRFKIKILPFSGAGSDGSDGVRGVKSNSKSGDLAAGPTPSTSKSRSLFGRLRVRTEPSQQQHDALSRVGEEEIECNNNNINNSNTNSNASTPVNTCSSAATSPARSPVNMTNSSSGSVAFVPKGILKPVSRSKYSTNSSNNNNISNAAAFPSSSAGRPRVSFHSSATATATVPPQLQTNDGDRQLTTTSPSTSTSDKVFMDGDEDENVWSDEDEEEQDQEEEEEVDLYAEEDEELMPQESGI